MDLNLGILISDLIMNNHLYFFLRCFVLCITAFNGCAQSSGKINVACLGASITYGARLENRELESYPAQLQRMLGEKFVVSNYGVSGTTLLRKGDHSYWNTPEYQSALKSHPDIVFIDLGGNDSKLINRIYLDEYEKDYHDLIKSFAQLPSHPRIILQLPIVSFVTDTSQIWDPVIVHKIIPRIQQVAFDAGVEVIDMHSLLADKPMLVPDQIHPDAKGSGIMAKKLYDVVTQKRDVSFDIFKKAPHDKVSSFHGYACSDFTYHGRACKIVKPKRPAKDHPWIWRARFWGHEPQTDIALLEMGFHVVFCDVAELFGNKEAVQAWNEYYSFLTANGLAKKAALEGMSRGGVYIYNWAAENPGKVSCVYADNPVLDMKDWPARLRNNEASKRQEWETFKKDYGYTSDEEAMTFAGSPIDRVEQIVKGHYPMLHVCGDADEDVPMVLNTIPFEEKIKALKGDITVIHKPGAKHHPHSLVDPTPIVEFILNAGGSR